LVRKSAKGISRKKGLAASVTSRHTKATREALPPYTKPPVREALIDIHTEPLSPALLPSLDSIFESLKDTYPLKRTRHNIQAGWQITGSQFSSTIKAPDLIGYVFQSTDGKQMVQMRLDGFTFNRLKPDPNEQWVGWRYVRDEARRTWKKYVEAVGSRPVTRFSVRYLNQIVIPMKGAENEIELDEYLHGIPKSPATLGYKNYNDFFSRLQFVVPDLDASAIITLVPLETGAKESVTIILDIDVFRDNRAPIELEQIWETLDNFRELKNRIFQASLTRKAQRLFL
jgi:uncharacterized protein (TIGR04255 family)